MKEMRGRLHHLVSRFTDMENDSKRKS
jgi:hypothetical protein